MSNLLARLGEQPERTLRLALVLNAQFSATGGAVAIAFAGPLADLMDVNAWIVRCVGAGLLLFAVDVWFASRRVNDQLIARSKLVSASDAAWVIGTVVVIAAGLVSGAGMVLLGVIGCMVADFAIVQIWSASKLTARVTVPQAA